MEPTTILMWCLVALVAFILASVISVAVLGLFLLYRGSAFLSVVLKEIAAEFKKDSIANNKHDSTK